MGGFWVFSAQNPLVELVVDGGFRRRRWTAGVENCAAETAAGEEEPPWAALPELAVPRSYLLSANWKMGISYLVIKKLGKKKKKTQFCFVKKKKNRFFPNWEFRIFLFYGNLFFSNYNLVDLFVLFFLFQGLWETSLFG